MTTKLNPPSQEEIDRLVSQQNGDTGFYLLAIFSFIEAYIRHNFEELKYSESKEQEHVYFPKIIRTLENFDSPFDSHSK